MTSSGIRMTDAHFDKAKSLAKKLGVTRNRLFSILVEEAEVIGEPKIIFSWQQKTADSVHEAEISGSGIAN